MYHVDLVRSEPRAGASGWPRMQQVSLTRATAPSRSRLRAAALSRWSEGFRVKVDPSRNEWASLGRYNRRTLVGQTISHYKILAKLGEGGMGVVYKAQDTRLDRTVALKFLAPHLVSSEDVRKRFIREAKTAAALQHPNICTVHEIDEADGRTFIAMAYLDGQELADEIEAGPLDLGRALDLAKEFAEGLAEAHSQGVVHRDIKPANLFVTSGGRGVILDFGLAQLASAESKLTREGTTLGTCAYMSPEQATGAEVDPRTDVWALGCVIYEMLAGQPPFRGHYEQAVVYSILNEQPEPLPASVGRLQDVVRKCLSKKVGDRYSDGADLSTALREAAQAKPSPSREKTAERPSVVILPFQNRSSDPEDEYFSDGVTEDVITTLGKLKDLRVIPRNSAFHFKGKRPQLHEIVEALDVSHVLEGSVRRAGDRVRISVELIATADGDQVWTERYDRVLEDIFDVQDEIAQAIASQLKIKLMGNQRLVEKPTSNDEAYQLYLRGKHLIYRLTGDSMHKGVDLLRQARQLDPAFAQAYAAEAFGHAALSVLGWTAPDIGFTRAKSLALKAIEMDESLAEAHMFHGLSVMFSDWDWPGAEAALRRALKLNPENPDVHSWLAELLIPAGRFDEGLAEAQRARELDPLSVETIRKVAMCQFFRRDYEAAIQASGQALELDPQHTVSHVYLGLSLYWAGKIDDAVESLRKACDSLDYDPLLHGTFGYVLAKAGRREEAQKSLSELQARQDKGLPSYFLIATVQVGLGEDDEALSSYERAVETREGLAIYTTWPRFDPIRDDPRFHSLRRKMNLE